MPLLDAQAQTLSNNDLVRGVIEEIIDVDQLFQFLPFVHTAGKAYVYVRENTLGSTPGNASGGAQFITTNVDVPEAAATFTEVSVTLRIIAGDVDVDNFIQETYSDTNDQKAVQIALKAKSVARLFADRFINGDSTTAYNLSTLGGGNAVTNVEFDGVDKLVDAGMVLNSDPVNQYGPLSFDNLDALLDLIKKGADVFVFSRRSVRRLKTLFRTLSAVSPEYVQLNNGTRVLAYSGVPVLLNDFISENQTVNAVAGKATVYALRLNEEDGLHGVFSGPSAGFRIVEIGQLEKRDATRTRIKWYCALALKSTKSIAKLVGVN